MASASTTQAGARMFPPVVISKHRPVDGTLAPRVRREIRELAASKEPEDVYELHLFLLAFSEVQRRADDDPMSFYQIAGVHGFPFQPYDKVDAHPNWKDGMGYGGYCWHGSQLFPTWHRAYMLLIEKAVCEAADGLVARWTRQKEQIMTIRKGDRDKLTPDERKDIEMVDNYAGAAKRLAFPYWDWADKESEKNGVPKIFTAPTYNVNIPFRGPDSLQTIANPLRAFSVPVDVGVVQTVSDNVNPMHHTYNVKAFANTPPYTPKGYSTVRHPDSRYKTQDGKLNTKFKEACKTVLRPNLVHMFAVDDYAAFSNHSQGDDDRDSVSLEGVHDAVHDALGGDCGHMGYPGTAGFDPIFFLHHSNVERQFTLWQILNPDSWIKEHSEKTRGTYTDVPNENGELTVTENTPLKPFRIGTESFWTSKDLREVEELGYTFPELQKWREKGLLADAETQKKSRPVFLEELLTKYGGTMLTNNAFRCFVELKHIQKQALDGPFSVEVHIGKKSAEGGTQPKAGAEGSSSRPKAGAELLVKAGAVYVFASGSGSGCAGCSLPSRQEMTGSVDITDALREVIPALFEPSGELTHSDGPNFEKAKMTPKGLSKFVHIKVMDRSGQQVTSSVVGNVRIKFNHYIPTTKENSSMAMLASSPSASRSKRQKTATSVVTNIVFGAAPKYLE